MHDGKNVDEDICKRNVTSGKTSVIHAVLLAKFRHVIRAL